MPRIDEILEIVKTANASDLHLAAGSVPVVRINGQLEKTRHKRLSADNIRQLVFEILTDEQIRRFESTGDLDFAYGVPKVARFRINLYMMHLGPAVAVRLIPDSPPSLADLGFCEHVTGLAQLKSGLVLVTGPTNSGKTTTLAAMVDHINTNCCRHVVTLEDPIEYVHESHNSLISQRQIGVHSQTFGAALRAALREDPDVIMVGEMRDTETIQLAITAAEVGLLVMGTLHTCSASATVDRVVDVFPPDQQQQVRVMLADSLQGVVSQQLVRRTDGHGRVMAYELMLRTTSIANLIREHKSYQIPNQIQTGRKKGMRLLDNHLKALLDSGQIDSAEAIRVANNPDSFLARTSEHEPEMADA